MAAKGEPRSTIGPRHARPRLLAEACAATFVMAFCTAHAQVAPPKESVRAATGVVIHYQEGRGANVLYLDEKGGRLTLPMTPVAAERETQRTAKAAVVAPAVTEPERKARRAAPRKAVSTEALP